MEACRNWQERLTAWYDGETSELDAKEVRAHLLDCAGCRATANRWKNLQADLALLQPEGPSAEAVDRMVLRFERGLAAEVRGMARAIRIWNLAAAVLVAAAAGFLLADRLLLAPTAQANSTGRLERDIERTLDRLAAEQRVWVAPEAEKEESAVPQQPEESSQ